MLVMPHKHPTFINKWYDLLHIIMWPYWFIDRNFACSSPLPWSIGAKSLLKLLYHMRCVAPKPPTYPSHLQPVHRSQAMSWSSPPSHMTPCHVSYAMSSFVTCVSLATNPSHLHCHGMSCSHTCTCGLITCVSQYKHTLLQKIDFVRWCLYYLRQAGWAATSVNRWQGRWPSARLG